MLRYFNGYILFPTLEKLKKREIRSKLSELKNFEAKENRIQIAQQKKLLYHLFIFCQKNIPYYQDLFLKYKFDPEKIFKDLRYIEILPTLTKDDVRENSERLKKPWGGFHERKTGGSTGQSVFFYYDQQGLDWTAAINLYALEMAGKKVHHKDCHIASELGLEPPSLKYQFIDWLKLFSQNRKRLMIESFSDENLSSNYKSLKKMKPHLLQGHPSSAYSIANFIERNNLKPIKLCEIFEPSGEMLTDKMVESIEKNLRCKVVNRYGNAEFGVMAHSRFDDSYNRLKIFRRAFHIEEAEQSNIIVTGITNHAFPLIRYDTGDIGTVRDENDGLFLYNIQGRIHDSVKINGQYYATHYIMDYLDHKVKNIREFQIIFKDESDIPILNIVPEKENDFDRITAYIKEKWGNGVKLNFIKYEQLQRVGWRQKFRHVIDQREQG